MPNSSEPIPNNTAAESYRLAYETLFAKLAPDVQAKVLQANSNPSGWEKEVIRFIKSVVNLAEADDKKA